MPKLGTADRVVINLRQVAVVRMQIRLKFRSLTTGALGSRCSYRRRQPFGPVIQLARPTLRVLRPPYENIRGRCKSARCETSGCEVSEVPIRRLRGMFNEYANRSPDSLAVVAEGEKIEVTFLLALLLAVTTGDTTMVMVGGCCRR